MRGLSGVPWSWTIPRALEVPQESMPDIDEKTGRTVAPIADKAASEPETQTQAPTESPDEAAHDSEEYERLLDMYDVSFKNFAEGEVVTGVVLHVSESEVIVDVGYKSEGIIAIEEFRDESGMISVKTGDTVDVVLVKTEDKDDYGDLSWIKAGQQEYMGH